MSWLHVCIENGGWLAGWLAEARANSNQAIPRCVSEEIPSSCQTWQSRRLTQPPSLPSLLDITRRIDEAKRKMGRVMQIAAFSLAEVTYAVGGDIGYQVQESARSARFRIRAKQENVSGVLLPAFESYLTEGNNDFAMTGLGKGGQQVQRCRDTYARAVEALVELASLQVRFFFGGREVDGGEGADETVSNAFQTAFVILDEVIKVVNRRGTSPPP